MSRHFHEYSSRYKYGNCRYRNKNRKIAGTALAVIGLLIIINVMSIRFLLLLIGLCLLLMGGLLYTK